MASSDTRAQDFEDEIKDVMAEVICTICEEDRPLYVLPCQHRFCKVCLDRLSANGSKKFPCPSCREVCRAPYGGFKKCRLSALVKEKMQTLQTQKLSFMTGSNGGGKRYSPKHCLTRLKEIYGEKRELYPMPDSLITDPPGLAWRQRTNPQVNCQITIPPEKTTIINSSFANLREYKSDDGKWRESREFTGVADSPHTFHSLHQMKSPYGTCYILQTISKLCSCDSLPVGRHAISCRCYRSYPDELYVLDDNWDVVNRWPLSSRVLAGVNDIIYCIDYHSSDAFQEGIVGRKPKHYVKRYTVQGQQLTPIHHETMEEPRHLKTMYSSDICKTVLLISDVGANKVFLFLDDELCWEWKPNGLSYRVGPVAIGETTGHLYAVVRTKRENDYDPVVPADCNYVKMLDWQGCEVNTLSFKVSWRLRERHIQDIEVKGHKDSPTESVFVMSDDSAYQDDNSREEWWELFPVVDASPVHTLIIMLQHWINVNGKRRVNSYILYILRCLCLLFVVILPVIVEILLLISEVWVLFMLGSFLLWLLFNFVIERIDFVEYLIVGLRNLEKLHQTVR